MSRLFSPVEWFAVIVLLLIIAYQDSVSSHLSRHYVTSLNGHVLSDVVLTNPVFVTYRGAWRIGSNGVGEVYEQPVTNILWHQWTLFGK